MKPFAVVDLTELMLSAREDLSLLELLLGAVNDGTVVSAAQLTDEELAAIGGESDGERAPWLASRPEPEATIAVREARRNLAAEELATFTVTGELVELDPALTALLWCRTNFTMIVVCDVWEPDDRHVARAILYRLAPTLLMMELVGPLGYHEITFCTSGAAAEWLADRGGAVDSDIDRQETDLTAESAAQLLRTLATTCRQRLVIHVSEAVEPGAQATREVTVFSLDDTTWLAELFAAEEGGEAVVLRQIGAGPLARYLAWFLTPASAGGPR